MPKGRRCQNHPDVDAQSICMGCGKPYCKQCLIYVYDVPYCHSCQDVAEQFRAIKEGSFRYESSHSAQAEAEWNRQAEKNRDAVLESPGETAAISPDYSPPLWKGTQVPTPKHITNGRSKRLATAKIILGVSILVCLAALNVLRSRGPWEYSVFGPDGNFSRKGTYNFGHDENGNVVLMTDTFGPIFEIAKVLFWLSLTSTALGTLYLLLSALPIYLDKLRKEQESNTPSLLGTAPVNSGNSSATPKTVEAEPKEYLVAKTKPEATLSDRGGPVRPVVIFVLGINLVGILFIVLAFLATEFQPTLESALRLQRNTVEQKGPFPELNEKTKATINRFYWSVSLDPDESNASDAMALQSLLDARTVNDLRAGQPYIHRFISSHVDANILGSKNHERLKDCAMILGVLADADSKEYLESLLEYPQRGVRSEAMKSLKRIEGKLAGAEEAAKTLAEQTRESTPIGEAINETPMVTVANRSDHSPSFWQRWFGSSGNSSKRLVISQKRGSDPVIRYPLRASSPQGEKEYLTLVMFFASADGPVLEESMLSDQPGRQFGINARRNEKGETEIFDKTILTREGEFLGILILISDFKNRFAKMRTYEFAVDDTVLNLDDRVALGSRVKVSASLGLCKGGGLEGWSLGFQRFVEPVSQSEIRFMD